MSTIFVQSLSNNSCTSNLCTYLLCGDGLRVKWSHGSNDILRYRLSCNQRESRNGGIFSPLLYGFEPQKRKLILSKFKHSEKNATVNQITHHCILEERYCCCIASYQAAKIFWIDNS